MLKRDLRLLANVSMRHAKISHSSAIIVKLSANELSHNRYGFIISKKVAKSAVKRNRAKRIIRACIEENLLKIKSGYDMLFIIKQQFENQKRTEVCSGVTQQLKVLKMLE